MFEELFSNMNAILDLIVNVLQILAFGLLFLLIFDSIHKRRVTKRETAAAKAAAQAVE